MYNIGDTVWYAGWEGKNISITCPECFGKKYLTVILGDHSTVTIDCIGCGAGYDPPRGYVTYHEHSINARIARICKVEITSDGINYGIDGSAYFYHTVKADELFDTKEGAEVKAQQLTEKWNKEQLAKIHRKEKNNKTWSWHVHYYRQQIRTAKKTIEYAETQLNAAKEHIKEGT